MPVSVWRQKSDFTPENGRRIFMYRNYFYREDLKVELTQLEEEDEKERFLEGSKHKRLIPGYVALEVKENTGKMPENFCWKESLKKDFSQKKTEDVFLPGSTGWRSYCIRNPEILPGVRKESFCFGI